jgi:ATP-dependent RNA helicase DeaD
MKFNELGLRDELLSAITALGFQTPMPIQKKAIPLLLAGERDFIGLAQTGTGKTAAFGLALLQRIRLEDRYPQGLVVCPTRELCLQVTQDIKSFSANLRGVNVVAVYGGASISQQISQLKRGTHIIVATPGRLLDLINRKAVKPAQVSCVVLDEADEMLNMGFKEDIDSILDSLSEQRVIWLFSATMEKGVADIAHTYLKNPDEITVGAKNQTAANIRHSYCMMKEPNRYFALKRLLDFAPDIYGIIFCRTRKETQTIAEALMSDHYQAEALHGDLSQAQRDYVMRKFRQKTVRVLVATDVAARGLDVNDLTHIIHYRLPDDPPVYTHRSGRTARAGKSGISIALVNTREVRRIQEIERKVNITFERERIPDGRAICEKQLFSLVDRVVNADVNRSEIKPYLGEVFQAFSGIPKQDIIQRFLSVEFNRFLEYYRDASDLNMTPQSGRSERPQSGSAQSARRGRRPDRAPRRERSSFPGTAFRLNAGHDKNANKGAIVRMICERAGITSDLIGDIKVRQHETLFEVHRDAAEAVKKQKNNLRLDGARVTLQPVSRKK